MTQIYPDKGTQTIMGLAASDSSVKYIDFNDMIEDHEQEDNGAGFLHNNRNIKKIDVWLAVPVATKELDIKDVVGIYITDLCGTIILNHILDYQASLIDVCCEAESMAHSIKKKTYEVTIHRLSDGVAAEQHSVTTSDYHPLQAIESSFIGLLDESKKVLPSNVSQKDLGVRLRACVGHGDIQYSSYGGSSIYRLASVAVK